MRLNGNLEVDVVVIGGGPAGAATALALRSSGFSVVVVERSDYRSVRIGETLPPLVQPLLTSLGVWDPFLAAKNLPSCGIHSAWGRTRLQVNDFIFNPYGRGWHVNRAEFDAMLARAAEGAGAVVLRGARFVQCTEEKAGLWRVGVGGLGSRRSLQAKFLVDASGRGSVLARKRGAVRVSHDHLIGAVAFLPANQDSSIPLECTLIEATEIGWWYSAVLPDEKVVVAFMTDADVYARASRGSPRFWQEELQRTLHTQGRVSPSRISPHPQVVAANSSQLRSAAGAGWLAVGDAAVAFDPLSAQGIHKALASGLRAGETIRQHFAGESEALKRYARWVDETFDTYMRQRSRFYHMEARWPASRFWYRRHSVPAKLV